MEFEKEFHCPTAIHVPSLSYEEDLGGEKRKVDVTLVGNSQAEGANVNSLERGSPKAHTFIEIRFQGLNLSQIDQILQDAIKRTKDGEPLRNVVVPDTIVHLPLNSTNLGQASAGRTEILSRYEKRKNGKSFFIQFSIDNVYCDRCFCKDSSEENPLVRCDVRDCLEGRHRYCFVESEQRSLKEIQDTSYSHSCCDHLDVSTRGKKNASSKKQNCISNCPPVSKSSRIRIPVSKDLAAQVIVESCDETGLELNCAQLKLRVVQSVIPQAGKGLVSIESLDVGETVAFFFGRIITKSLFEELTSNSRKKSVSKEGDHDHELVAFFKDYNKGVRRILDVSDSLSDATDEYVMLVSKQCPAGYINDPHLKDEEKKKMERVPTTNCKVVYPPTVTMSKDGMIGWKMFCVQAIQSIEAEGELFIDYNWDERTWRSVEKTIAHIPIDTPLKPVIEYLPPSFLEGTPPEEYTRRANDFYSKMDENPKAAFAEIGTNWENTLALERSQKRSILSDLNDSARPALNRKAQEGVTPSNAPMDIDVVEEKGVEEIKMSDDPSIAPPPEILSPVYLGQSLSALMEESDQESESTPPQPIVADVGPPLLQKTEVYEPYPYLNHMSAEVIRREGDDGFLEEGEVAEDEIEEPQESENESDEKSDEISDEEYEESEEGYKTSDEENPESIDIDKLDQKKWSPSRTKRSRSHGGKRVGLKEGCTRFPPASNMKMIIRNKNRVRKLSGLRDWSWTEEEMRTMKSALESYFKRNEARFDGSVINLLTLESRNRLVKFNNLPLDYGEIKACCGSAIRCQIENIPLTHPFQDVTKLLERRLDIVGQRNDNGTRQCILDYLKNQTMDPELKKPYRTIIYDGVRCCVSCFRAATGVSRDTFFSVNNQLKNGELVAVDLRSKQKRTDKVPEETLKIATELRAMIEEQIPDSYPTNEGGISKESFEFPFFRRAHLREEVEARLNKKFPEKAISATTFERAIKYLADQHMIHISIKRNKKFMKCDTCITLLNEKHQATSSEAREKNRVERNNHYMQTNRQRKGYTDIRTLAK